MKSLNFEFFTTHDERLATLGELAECYFRDGPSTAIVKPRQFAELMARLITVYHSLYRDERETFEETLLDRIRAHRAAAPKANRGRRKTA